MKIKLLTDIPVDKKHGMIKDRELEVIKEESYKYKERGSGGMWVMGDASEQIKILKEEYTKI